MTLWSPTEKDLRHLDALKARDLIIQCFFESQKEKLIHKPELLHNPTAQKEARSSVVLLIREIFKEIGGSFHHPTVPDMRLVIDELAKKARHMGTPSQTIAHHKKIISAILDAVADTDEA